MHHVSEHFICIPLRFPCRPWLYRKLSQWLINRLGRSMREPGARGRADAVSVYSGMGSILVVKNSRASDVITRKKHADTYNMGSALNQNAVMISKLTRKWLMCITHVYCIRRDSLSAPCLCCFHPSTDQLQDTDKRRQTTFVDVKLHSFPYRQQTAAVTWHHVEEEPSPPSVPSFGQLHHMGLPVFTPQLVGRNIHFLFCCKVSGEKEEQCWLPDTNTKLG